MENLTKLNLGCGADKRPGYLNIDWNPLTDPDVLHDLNSLPYPFPDSCFEHIKASHVLEHLDKPFEIIKELHRILKPGGTLLVKVPHFSRGFTHAEHAHGFDITFPLYFDSKFTKSGYIGTQFRINSVRMEWMAFFHLLPSMGYGNLTVSALKAINVFISFLANLSPAFCSRVWCFWVGGFEEVEFRFTCVK